MATISSSNTATQASAITKNESSNSESTSAASVSDDFKGYMLNALGKEDTSDVSEEELFAALIQKEVATVDSSTEKLFKDKFEEMKKSLARADGIVSYEDAANKTLDFLINDGTIDSTTAEKLRSTAFRAAQLDNNLDKLYDDRGSANDPTVAIAKISEALVKIQQALSDIAEGKTTVTESSASESSTTENAVKDSSSSSTSNGNTARSLDGDGGFLWKATSESDGNLVVLLPTDIKASSISSVEVHSGEPFSSSTLLGQGTFSGDTANGGRAHFRFSKPGSQYGSSAYLVAKLNDGSSISYLIENPGERND
ncbi:MAG: hypothetical protein PHC51_04875 [bacterium]|nr:hypothetical protein [bacterium]